jgi:hypothetical protein
MAAIEKRAYFTHSKVLLQIARDSCGATPERRLNAIVALVFAAFYVEAAINELLHLVTNASSPGIVAGEPSLRRLRDLAVAAALEERGTRFNTKLQLVSAGLRDKLFDEGAQPFQDLNLLMSLRHSVVHNRPETLKLGEMEPGDPSVPQEELDRLYRSLIARGIVPKPDRFVLTSLFSALSRREVAVWSVNTALIVVEELATALPSEHWRSSIFLGHDFTPVSP